MCGRYTLTTDTKKLSQHFNLLRLNLPRDVTLFSRYNAAPTQPMPIVRDNLDHHQRELAICTWGLVPGWAKDPTIGGRMINARSETITEKPAYKTAFKRKRCLVPATGFYEWRPRPADAKPKTPKQPVLIRMADESLFAFAGLYEHWQDEHGNELETFTIITTGANELLATVHHRMPVIIDASDYDRWLSADSDAAASLLRAYPAGAMMMHPVSTMVNNARNEDARCIIPIDAFPGSAVPDDADQDETAQKGLFDEH